MGTAVQITPVGSISHNNTIYEYNNKIIGPVTKKLKGKLTKIQTGEADDSFSNGYFL